MSFLNNIWQLKGGGELRKKHALLWVLHNIPELIAATGLIVAITVTIINVFTRYVLDFTYAGCDEIVILGFAWTIFPGCAAAYKRNMHFGIDAIIGLFSQRVQRFMSIGLRVFLLIFTAYMTYLSYILATKAWVKILTATRIPYFYLDLALVVGFAFMTGYSILFIIEEIKDKKVVMEEEGGNKNDF